jgi:tripartite-type tricarboxylate transporter receptor subunit TctC
MHLTMELLKKATGANLVHVPYRGSAPAVTDLLGGQIPVACVDITSAFPHIQAGNLIALGLMDKKRTPLAPDIPTIAEAGVPGYELTSWVGILAPVATSQAVLGRIHASLLETLRTTDVRNVLLKSGAEPLGNTSEEFAQALRRDIPRWNKIIKAAGIKPE